MDIRNRIMETCMEGENLGYNMIKTASGHYGIKLETAEKENDIMYMGETDDLTSFKAI